jgi:hypothetical protein
MSETLGGLVDKLTITNLKLWFVQDRVHEAAKNGEGLDPETVARLHTLNLQRNSLMSEIDMTFAEGVQSGEADVDPRVKLT